MVIKVVLTSHKNFLLSLSITTRSKFNSLFFSSGKYTLDFKAILIRVTVKLIASCNVQFYFACKHRLSIAPHLRMTVYQTVIKHGGTMEWEFLWSKYQEETDASHKGKIMLGLTSSRQPWLLQR